MGPGAPGANYGGEMAEGAKQAQMRRKDLSLAAGNMRPGQLDSIGRGLRGMMGGLTGGNVGQDGAQAGGVPPPGLDRAQPRPRASPLGLGLGLNRFQRGNLLEARDTGGVQGIQDFLSERPGIAQRFENRAEGPRGDEQANFLATGETPTGAEVRYGRRPRPGVPSMEQLQRPQPIGPGMEPRAPTAQDMAAKELSREEAPQPDRSGIRAARQGMQGARQGMRQARQEFRQQRRGMR